jgi:UDP-N-acetylmuramoylalanine--D-glutamate ligase
MTTARLKVSDLAGQAVAIWGLGRDMAATLARIDSLVPRASVSIFADKGMDSRSIEMARSHGHCVFLESPKEVLSSHRFEVLIRSPGVSVYRPEIALAKERGAQVTTSANLWFSEVEGKKTILGITGTKGKSTTTALVAHILRSVGIRAVACGNIGTPLFDATVRAADTVVIELSSYQLADFCGRIPIAALLNLYPEHLDWHNGKENYFRDKLNIFEGQRPDDVAIVHAALSRVVQYLGKSRRLTYFGNARGIHARPDGIYVGAECLSGASALPLEGAHNMRNIAAALTIAQAAHGIPPAVALAGSSTFHPLPHRLEHVTKLRNVLYIDDSIATVPEAAVAAVEAFLPRRVTLIVGGFDRGLAWSSFAGQLAAMPLNAVVTVPDTGTAIADSLEKLSRAGSLRFPVFRCRDMQEAVQVSMGVTPAGGVVLLSPAAPSYNFFRDFEERGEAFREAVLEAGRNLQG